MAAPGAVNRGAHRRLPVAQRREQLLDAALDLFGRHAPEDVSLDDVAAAAGVSRPLVYRYFPGGKQQLYEAALRTAADDLSGRFLEPATGTPTQRLSNALDRYLAFVDERDAGYAALLRGGYVTETSRTTAIVDGVRRGALEQILAHLALPEPSPRLVLALRSWIASVEMVSLAWLDQGKQPPADELRSWLVDHFVGLLVVTAAGDATVAAQLRPVFAAENRASPAGSLARRLDGISAAVAHLR
ncbi:TetR/AcrR family transcriptional regulator [Wenjunlia vitaminophila]|uniref:TetR/AcrR family transcriptional regulator n=1 Tax=Wenjunlia vitaminophila TaxID=76728 RepID=UPI00039B2158|nr:TetR/AcrR family transcriptional regulator [Wenjunlia vitaminophila]